MNLNRHELELIHRALGRTLASMRSSKFISDDDRHLAKCEELAGRVVHEIEGAT